jgi:uncharacterized membrane protein YeaQ/YmgE (transglycosylase-associated protein family)
VFWLIRYAIFGLIVGLIARLLHPGRDAMNWLWTMLLGIGGSIVGGWLGMLLGFNTDAYVTGWIFAVIGAILLLVIYHRLTNPRLGGTPPSSSGRF